MKQTILANKEQSFDLYCLAHERIKECERFEKEIISFPKVFQKLCRSFSIKKAQAWKLLFILANDFDLIKIVPYHGVIVK